MIGFGSEDDIQEDREMVKREEERRREKEQRRAERDKRKRERKEKDKDGVVKEGINGVVVAKERGSRREAGKKLKGEVGAGRMEVDVELKEGSEPSSKQARASTSRISLPASHQNHQPLPSTTISAQQPHPRAQKEKDAGTSRSVQLQPPPSPPPRPPHVNDKPEPTVVASSHKRKKINEEPQQKQEDPSFIENSVLDDDGNVDLMDIQPPSQPNPNLSQPPNTSQQPSFPPSQPSQLQHPGSSTPQPLTRSAPPLNFLPRHLTDSTAITTPPSSYLTNVTTPGNDSTYLLSDSDAAGPSVRKKPKESKSNETYQPPHIKRMLLLKRNASANNAAGSNSEDSAMDVGVGVVDLGAVAGKGKGKGKASTSNNPPRLILLSKHAEKINDEVVRLKKIEAQAAAAGGKSGGGLEKAERMRLRKLKLFDGLVFFVVFSEMTNLLTEKHAAWLEKVSGRNAAFGEG